MTSVSDPAGLEARFERELARDRRLLEILNHATLAASILIVTVLLVLIIPLARKSPWLMLLPVYAVATRLSVFVARRALGLPRFLLELDSSDPVTATAARAVFERERETIARTLLTAGNDTPSADRVRTLSTTEAARVARDRDLPGRRRTALICAGVWTIASIAIWATLIATRAGPTH